MMLPLLSKIREESMNKFLGMNLPQEREEDWRYTTIDNIEFTAGDSEIMMSDAPEGVIFTDILTAMKEHSSMIEKHMKVKIMDKFSAFHYANLVNGIFIHIPDEKSAELSSVINGASHTVIVLGKNSKLKYTEEYSGTGLTDGVEIFAGEDSEVNLTSVHNSKKTFSFKHAALERSAKLDWTVASVGEFHRTRMDIDLCGEAASSDIKCAFKGRNEQHKDFLVTTNHIGRDTQSNVLGKGILDDRSTSVFRGMINIAKTAQRTDAYLSSNTLLLSEEARANSVPSLVIDTDDVKAKHGATTGQIDEEQLFYLQSRGLSEAQAEEFIVQGFFEPIVNDKLRGVLNGST